MPWLVQYVVIALVTFSFPLMVNKVSLFFFPLGERGKEEQGQWMKKTRMGLPSFANFEWPCLLDQKPLVSIVGCSNDCIYY